MNFNQARFVGAYGSDRPLPKPHDVEVVFAGRSNVGKSSLINRLVQRKNLARTSSQPGKTQTINFYQLDAASLVDLPGYGYAKVSQKEREAWGRLISNYFESERPIRLVVSLIDLRHDPTELDLSLLAYIHDLELTPVVALTKADKLSRAQRLRQQQRIEKLLPFDPVQTIITSAVSGEGVDQLRRIITHACTLEPDQAL